MDRKGFRKNLCTVFTDEHGQHHVMAPNGELLSYLKKTVVVDEIGKPSEVTLTIKCNLATDYDDAIRKYKLSGVDLLGIISGGEDDQS